MSGQAGAARQERYYLVEYLSGIIENIAVPPWEENKGDYIARQFKEKSAPYEKKLNLAIPHLNYLFSSLITHNEYTLVEYEGEREWICGVVVEDKDPGIRHTEHVDEENFGRRWFLTSKEKAAYVKLSIPVYANNFDCVEIVFAVKKQIKRSDLNIIADEIKKIFL